MNQTQLFAELLSQHESPALNNVRIEFDGGTPCNIPSKGYGDGYGSYQLCCNGHVYPIERVNFGRPMSNNVAEISVLIRAIEAVARLHKPEKTILEIHGDSQIALLRTTKAFTPRKKLYRGSADYIAACHRLHTACAQFHNITTHWRGRERSVKIFGH